jgi:hypothetical protein
MSVIQEGKETIEMATVRNIIVEIPVLSLSFSGKITKRFEEKTTPELVKVHNVCHQPVQERARKGKKSYDSSPVIPSKRLKKAPSRGIKYLCRQCRKRVSVNDTELAYLTEEGRILVPGAEAQAVIDRARPDKNIMRIEHFTDTEAAEVAIRIDSYFIQPGSDQIEEYALFQRGLKQAALYGTGLICMAFKKSLSCFGEGLERCVVS